MDPTGRRYIDCSHTVKDGLETYRGLPAPAICDYWTREDSAQHYAPGTSFQIGKIEMVANTGTYIDAPFHRFADGNDLSQLPLSSIADVDGLVIRIPKGIDRIDASFLEGAEVRDRAVLFHTGWSKHWETDAYFSGHPYLTEDTANTLLERGARLVGIDSLNIDDTKDGRRPVHTVLLGGDVPVVEHLTNLASLPVDGFRFFAVPVKVKSFGSFPIRAFGVVP